MRSDGRNNDQLRSIKLIPYYLEYPHGSVLIEIGKTKVLCTAYIDESVPKFLRGKNMGWVTSEYSMLPASTKERKIREISRGKPAGRNQEIQRMIGRSLRAGVDMEAIGERTIWVDCDVLQADGGTRTASITAGFLAVALACKTMVDEKIIKRIPIINYIAAVSVGVVEGRALLDLNYVEDSNADVDMNVVMTSTGEFVELQGSAEGLPFDQQQLQKLLDLADCGIKEIVEMQKEIIRL